MNKLYYTECRIYLYTVLRDRIWDKEKVTL
jgi:hypothetical protein